jgi:hypothetical protein
MAFMAERQIRTRSVLLAPEFSGWAYPYADWPQSLKDEYAYNVEGAKLLLTNVGYPDGFDTNVGVSIGIAITLSCDVGKTVAAL